MTELIAGAAAGSVSLQADAMDFLGDAANYLISLLVLGMALQWRARAALLKGLSLGVVGPVGGRSDCMERDLSDRAAG